jgi:uncharacterized membrane protein YhaH (DUF805 family)
MPTDGSVKGGIMDFGTAISTCFRKYADFQGRARRSEYWYFMLFCALCLVAVAIAAKVLSMMLGSGSYGFGLEPMSLIEVMIIVFGLAVFLPYLAVTVRRFHDLGVTGWFLLAFILASLIPIIGFLARIGELIWFCMRGTDGENNYGPDPYDPDPAEVFS